MNYCLIYNILETLVFTKKNLLRWWPAKVVPPENLPNKIELLPHQVGGECDVDFLHVLKLLEA